MPKFQKPITRPLGHPEPKNFVFPSFTLGDTSTPKMSKIGEIRVLSYLHLSWNAPERSNKERIPEFLGNVVNRSRRNRITAAVCGSIADPHTAVVILI